MLSAPGVGPPSLNERDLSEAAARIARGDFRGTLAALVGQMTTALTGHPILGSFVQSGADAIARLLLQDATHRFLSAGKELEEEQSRIAAYQQAMVDAAKPLLAVLWDQNHEHFVQLCARLGTFIERQDDLRNTLERLGCVVVSSPAPSVELRATDCMDGPLTLEAVLEPPSASFLPGYPTGDAGAHLVFDLHNANCAADFSVSHIGVYVIEVAPVAIRALKHGVGATDVVRKFRGKLPSRSGFVRAQYDGSPAGSYVKVLRGRDERFDVELVATEEGLYCYRLTIIGSMAGQWCEIPVGERSCSIVFFRKGADYVVDWSPRMMRYCEYIDELAANSPSLRPYAP